MATKVTFHSVSSKPNQLTVGGLYFNTADKKIYKAISQSTWEAYGGSASDCIPLIGSDQITGSLIAKAHVALILPDSTNTINVNINSGETPWTKNWVLNPDTFQPISNPDPKKFYYVADHDSSSDIQNGQLLSWDSSQNKYKLSTIQFAHAYSNDSSETPYTKDWLWIPTSGGGKTSILITPVLNSYYIIKGVSGTDPFAVVNEIYKCYKTPTTGDPYCYQSFTNQIINLGSASNIWDNIYGGNVVASNITTSAVSASIVSATTVSASAVSVSTLSASTVTASTVSTSTISATTVSTSTANVSNIKIANTQGSAGQVIKSTGSGIEWGSVDIEWIES